MQKSINRRGNLKKSLGVSELTDCMPLALPFPSLLHPSKQKHLHISLLFPCSFTQAISHKETPRPYILFSFRFPFVLSSFSRSYTLYSSSFLPSFISLPINTHLHLLFSPPLPSLRPSRHIYTQQTLILTG